MKLLRNIAAGDIAAGTPETMPVSTSALWKGILFPFNHDSVRLVFSELTKADATDVPQFVIAVKILDETNTTYLLPYKRIVIASGQTTVDTVELDNFPPGVALTIYVDTLPASDDVACTVFYETYRKVGNS